MPIFPFRFIVPYCSKNEKQLFATRIGVQSTNLADGDGDGDDDDSSKINSRKYNFSKSTSSNNNDDASFETNFDDGSKPIVLVTNSDLIESPDGFHNWSMLLLS